MHPSPFADPSQDAAGAARRPVQRPSLSAALGLDGGAGRIRPNGSCAAAACRSSLGWRAPAISFLILLGAAAAVHAGEAPESGPTPPRTLQEAGERLLHLRYVELPSLSDEEQVRRRTLEAGEALLAFADLLAAKVERGELDRGEFVRLLHPMAIAYAESHAFGGSVEPSSATAAGGPEESVRRQLASPFFQLVGGTELEIDSLASWAWTCEREGSFALAASALERAVRHREFLASPTPDSRARHVALLRRLAGLYERRMVTYEQLRGFTLYREEAVATWDAYFEAGWKNCAFSTSAEELVADWGRFVELASGEGWAIPNRLARRRQIDEAARRIDAGTYTEWAASRCFADADERKARERAYRKATTEALSRSLEGESWPLIFCIATTRRPEGERSPCLERADPHAEPPVPCSCG